MSAPIIQELPGAILAAVSAIERAIDNRAPKRSLFGKLFGNADERRRADLERKVAAAEKELKIAEANLATENARVADLQRRNAHAEARVRDLQSQIDFIEKQNAFDPDAVADLKLASLGIVIDKPFRKNAQPDPNPSAAKAVPGTPQSD